MKRRSLSWIYWATMHFQCSSYERGAILWVRISRVVSNGMGDLFVCDIFDASPKNDLGSMEHPLFALSTRPDCKIRTYHHNGIEVMVTPSVRGRATIHDKDILIYCISQLMSALNAGRRIDRALSLTAYDFLTATRRDTSGDSYARLRESFERLAGTRITTNLKSGGLEVTSGFGLIESWEIVRKTNRGRMVSVKITLSEWLYQAVLAKSVLTLNREYFSLRKPLERRVYELSRKHCGYQREWVVSLKVLHHKSGSDAPLRVFRAAIRKMIAAETLPDYLLSEEPGDRIRVTRGQAADDVSVGLFEATVYEQARQIAPGADVYAMEADWRAFWQKKGRTPLKSPERAFLGWVRELHKV